MPVAGGGFEQCYNAQAVVAAGSLLVVAADVVQAPNDKQQLEPMLEQDRNLPAELGKPATLLADNGYFSEANVDLCAAARIEPVIALGREAHHPPLAERLPGDRRRRRTPRRSKRCAIACRRPKARSSMPCASRRRSRCSASSSRCWGSASSCCAASKRSAASGAS